MQRFKAVSSDFENKILTHVQDLKCFFRVTYLKFHDSNVILINIQISYEIIDILITQNVFIDSTYAKC